MKLASLTQVGRSPELPQLIELPTGLPLELCSLLRVLPGQRYVGQAQWQGRTVLAKLLVGGKAERHFARELQGAQLLAAQGLSTPLLLEQGVAAGEGGWLLFEFLEGARSLADDWQAVAREAWLSDAQQPVSYTHLTLPTKA